MTMDLEYSSYRDPIARIFYYNDEVYRFVDGDNFDYFHKILARPAVKKMMDSGDLIKTEVVEIADSAKVTAEFNSTKFLRHERVKFISYPYEWPFSMFKEAALFTLEMQKKLIAENLSLKDGTPYNVQFSGTKPVFIDFCSIEDISDNGVWFAYNQFMQMFVYPLILKVYRDISFRDLLLSNIDGIPHENAYQMAGLKPRILPKLFPYLTLPKLFSVGSGEEAKKKDAKASQKKINPQSNQAVQTFMINRLIKLISGFNLPIKRSTWSDYSQTKSYADKDNQTKHEFLTNFYRDHEIKTTLDLGANTGEFSFIAEAAGSDVTAVDLDHNSVEKLYLLSREKKINILPLVVELANPSPGIGWGNQERKSFLDRYRADCVLSLALIHHLLISNRQPLSRIVDLFARVSKRYLITEYIGQKDSMFELLIMNRKESYEYFNLDFFRTEFQKKFKILQEVPLPNMDRRLFLMEKTE